MGARSVWLYLSGVTAAVLLAFSFPAAFDPDAQAQPRGAENAGQTQPFRLAQSFYYPNYPQARPKPRRRRPAVTIQCAFPWTYSRGLQRCICVRDGYGVSEGQCIKVSESCPRNAEWSEADQECRCREGFIKQGSNCINPDSGTRAGNAPEGRQCLWPLVQTDDGAACSCAHGYREIAGRCVQDAGPVQPPRRYADKNELLTSDVSLVQRCLKEAGYLKAPVEQNMGRKAWTAFWFFKQDHAVGRTPKGVHEPKAQHRLFTLCPQARGQLAALPAAVGPLFQGPAAGAPPPGVPVPDESDSTSSKPNTAMPKVPAPDGLEEPEKQASLPTPGISREVKPAPGVAPPAKPVYAKPEAGCLPEDLHRLIIESYGPRPALRRCTQTCIAMPASITKQEAQQYEAKRGVQWCRSCIEIGSQLPLDDILRIEQGADVQVCTRPPSRLPKWTPVVRLKRPAYTRARALYRQFPPGTGHDGTVAVIIGNKTYRQGLPANDSAHASAGAVYALLTEHLGLDQENIIDLRDATLEAMTKVFGSQDDVKGQLWRLLRSRPGARVVIYYAGHGGTLEDLSDSYLLPVDAVKFREARSGYLMSRLYANLEKLGAKSVLLLLETNFNRDLSDYVFPPNLPDQEVDVLPKTKIPGLTVFIAADGNQKTLDDPAFGIGLFTRYLIEGLAGRADLAPIGNGDRNIDMIELYAYTSHMVRLAARKSFGLLQKPIARRSGKLRINQVQTQGQ